MSVLVYDSGALIAAERNDRRLWALHERALARGSMPVVPAVILGECWRGEGWSLTRLLRGCEIEHFTEEHARAAGLLLANGPEVGIADAAVVECTLRRRGVVVTGNLADLQALAPKLAYLAL